jgi:RND family efflux transporter MFP subunit
VTSEVSQTTIDADKTISTGTRTSWSALITSLSGTKDNLTAKTAAFDIAQKQGGSGTTNTTSGTAIAQTKSGVQLAEIALEKTIIRSPISGTINSLPVSEGDFVSPQQPAATVSNNGSLEIVAYITDIDSREISVDSNVAIQNTASGVVTRIAPALDPLTKKIEVRIGVSSGLSTLRNGQSVNLSITRSKEILKNSSQKDLISIPIVSLKITPDGAVVFTVEHNILKAHGVKIGSLLGDRIVITDGITSSMEIVTDARGLKDGESVEIK